MSERQPASAAATDPITAEIIRHGLNGAADQMRVSLIRTAFSPIIYEIVDFAAALYDSRVRLLSQAHALPLFMGTLGYAIEATLERVGGAASLRPGDVLFSTYAYDIGSHPQDAVVIVPIFHAGELIGYSAIKAHHMDIGAKQPYCTDTTDNFQEGTIFPGVKLYREGERQEDVYRILLANSRMPRALVGDLSAQVGAARVGGEALLALIERYGAATFAAAVDTILDQSEAEIRSVIEQIPDGTYRERGSLDNDGISDEPVPFEVAVIVEGAAISVDLREAPPARPGPVNTPRASV
ncbi:MAG TPA: hydantoinase B/oxoprolinase family protein, partial [Solirubrobacterales bacterium]|nr:hydantoinase B/oxoprolinase family protein [Solirubrobacterales bacterium]